MVGEINIHGEIGSKVTIDTVKADIAKTPEATEWNVYIFSQGGNVYEGIDIYHEIKALPNVTVIIEGLCASIATLIMQAGKKIVALAPSDIMIHNPFGAPVQGEEKDYKAAAAQLSRAKSTIISVLKQRLNTTDAEASKMMDEQTWFSAEQAKEIGLIDEVQNKLKCVASWDYKKPKTMETPVNKKEVQGMFEEFGNKILKVLNLMKIKNSLPMKFDDGTDVVIDTDNDQDLKDKGITMADGTPVADGTYTLADGREIDVAGGVITEVETIQANADDAMKKENEALKAELATLKQQLEAKAAAETASNTLILEMKNSIIGIKKDFDTLKNASVGTADNVSPNVKAEHERQQIKESFQKNPMLLAFANDAAGVFADNLSKN